MSKNRVLLSFLTVAAIVCMASETATAQLFKGRRNAACCGQVAAPAPSCCGQVAEPAPSCCGQVAEPAPCCGATAQPYRVRRMGRRNASSCCAAPVAAPCCGGVAASAPMSVVAPAASSCCGGSVVNGSIMQMETGVVVSGGYVQASPSDNIMSVENTTTANVIEPPAAATLSDTTPEEN